MRRFSFILMLILTIACNKDEDPEKYTSYNGYWIVRTPDDLTEVTFRIAADADNVQIVDAVSLMHNGSVYNREVIDAELAVTSPTELEFISFRTNDFVIRLWTITLNDDFTEMQITNSSFVIDKIFREFPMLTASRK